jgi:hypothetical protein
MSLFPSTRKSHGGRLDSYIAMGGKPEKVIVDPAEPPPLQVSPTNIALSWP